MQEMEELAIGVRWQGGGQRLDPLKQRQQLLSGRPIRRRFRRRVQFRQCRVQRLFSLGHVSTTYANRQPIPSGDACKPCQSENTPVMAIASAGAHPRLLLGIEGGATHTRAVLANAAGELVGESEGGPANIRLLSDAQLASLLDAFRRALSGPDGIAIGLAGARTEVDRQRIRQASAKTWPGVPCYATNDLETALMAAGPKPHEPGMEYLARVLILSGTGSCCYGRSPAGNFVKLGGWGHLLGDRGSAYSIGLFGLQDTLRHFDRTHRLSALGLRLLQKLGSNSPEEWVDWIQHAGKPEIAALAVEVFAAYPADPIARRIVRAAAVELADDAFACAKQVRNKGTPVEIILAGGALLKQPLYANLIRRRICALLPGAIVRRLPRAGVWGAIELARIHSSDAMGDGSTPRLTHPPTLSAPNLIRWPELDALALSPTEQRNRRSMRLSALPLDKAIRLMLQEDRRIIPALLRERVKLERAIKWIVRSFHRGGRLFYVGAGTSGRLGVLDASECPPTFRSSPDQVQGIIAGGAPALRQSVEGAEDDPQSGAESIRLRGVTDRDVVVGIAASGRTPFVWGALWQAGRQGAKTILLCFNPLTVAPRGNRPDLIIAPDVGPEILTGSTRLKSGTATKLILNLFTTLAMVRLGKVVSNLMVDLDPSNAKLRERAIRVVRQLSGATESAARGALEHAHWIIKDAVRHCRRKRRTLRL